MNLNLMDCARTINIVFINLVTTVNKMVVFRIKFSQKLWLQSWYDYCYNDNVKCNIIYLHEKATNKNHSSIYTTLLENYANVGDDISFGGERCDPPRKVAQYYLFEVYAPPPPIFQIVIL